MKRLFKLGLIALMGVCGFVGISRADDPETTTPATAALTSPTFTPASGETITPNSTIEFTLPSDLNVADYGGMAFILYVENKPDVTLESTPKILSETMNGGIEFAEGAAADAPAYEIAMVDMSDDSDGSEVMNMKPVTISTESGAVAFRARLAVIGKDNDGNDIVLYSEEMTANYTVEGEAVVVKPTAPTFSLEAGTVNAKSTLTLSNGYTGMDVSLHPIYYIINGNSTDFTGVANMDAIGASDLKNYTEGDVISIDRSMTILAATAKIDGSSTEGAITWSDIVSKTYVVPDVPAIDKAAGAYTTDTKITIALGNADSIFVATGKAEADATAFVKALANVTVTLTADTVIRAYAMIDGKYSDTVVRTYTIKSEEEPAEGVFTFTPAPSETAMDAGTKITVVYSDATRDIYYQWFVDEATAKAATFDEDWAWITGNFKPELTAAKPVLKVVALDDDEEVIADSVVVYVVKAAPALPTLDLTFNPVSGSSVAPSAKITVEIAELGEGEELDYKWFETKEEADAAQWDKDWFIYEDDQPEAYLERGLDKDTLYLKVALVEVDEGWNGTVKGYGQATYIVDIELVDKIVITPANKTLVREGDSVNIEVVFGGEATEGTLVYKWYETINAANADMNFMTTAQTYNNAIKPVITRANPILTVGYKNAEGWLIKPVTVEYFFDPVVTGFTVEAAGKNEMKEDTVVFDGMASFVFHTEGNVINGLQVAAKLYSKDYSDTITTNSYDATDTLAQFVDLYNGEYVVNFSLRHAYASDKDSVMADTTIYFNVTNYAEPVNPVDPELTVEAAGKHTTIADTIVFNEAAFALQIAGELIENDSLGNYTVSIEVYTQAAYDAWEEADTTYVYGADTINGKTVEFAALEEGRYVARFFLTRINGLMPEELEGAQEIFFQITTEEINTAIEAGELAGVNVYPNPNAGTFNVVVPERARIDIFGLNGAKVLSREVNAGVEAFNLTHSGIYFVRVMAGNKTAVKRVVVR